MQITKIINPFWPEDSDFSDPKIGDVYRVELENGNLVGNAEVLDVNDFSLLFTVESPISADFELLYSTEHIDGRDIQIKFVVGFLHLDEN